MASKINTFRQWSDKSQFNQLPSALDRVLDFSSARVVSALGVALSCDEAQAKNEFERLKKFLYLCSIATARLTPTKRIDQSWHEFLRCVDDYQFFCRNVLGKTVLHIEGVRSNEVGLLQLSATRRAWVRVFGERDMTISLGSRLEPAHCADCEGGEPG